jgi:excisionase family DNA binding protein
MDTMERLFTPRELAEIAGVSAQTIKREVARGRLRGIRIGEAGLVRVPESSWKEYLQRTGTRRATPIGEK